MGNLVFQATLGGQVNLVGPNTASTFNINVPTVNGNMVTTGDTGTVTNTMCATSVYTAPGTIGSGTPNTGAFTTLTTTSTINNLTVGRGAGAVSTNTAVGASALQANSTASNVTALGYQAAYSHTAGSILAVGSQVLYSNTTGDDNVAIGNYRTMYSNTTGSSNTAIGRQALQANTTASNNTAVGYQAGYSGTVAANNTFVGYQAGYANNSGGAAYNTFVGYGSGSAVTGGYKHTIIGAYTGNQGGLDIRTANNYIVLSDVDGNPRLYYSTAGGTWVSAEIYASTTASAANMMIAASGTINRSTSALKYKQDIRDVEDFDISALRPVRYKSKCESDDQTKDHLGLIADEAAEAGFEELVTRNEAGEVEGFQYERLTVVLLKSLQSLKAEFDAYKEAHP